jgi:hypothetical protein
MFERNHNAGDLPKRRKVNARVKMKMKMKVSKSCHPPGSPGRNPAPAAA